MKILVDSKELLGPVAVTVAYFVLWYALLFGKQSRTKYKLIAKYKEEGKEFDRYGSNDPEMLAADRAVGNTQEQMVPFLASFWLFAIVVSSFQATILGASYVVLRAIYPFMLGSHLSKVQPKRVFFVTGPCYVIIFSMFGMTLYKLL
ncbi:MAG: MAPEG family protein [Deltaproteobacteria bacterium]|nr:MAG: MAPEG family protein [Deltaproteobacteria bacterium]